MNLTKEQEKIVCHDLDQGQKLKVIAFAGSGKTTTLYEYTKIRPHLRFLYVSFNKSTQLEAEKKFPGNVTCKTSHSLAYKDFGVKYRKKLVPGLKSNIVLDALDLDTFEDAQFSLDTLLNYLVSSDDLLSKKHIPTIAWQFYKTKKKTMVDLVQLATTLWKLMTDINDDTIGMLHDGYLKLYQLSRPKLEFDCILLDEAQDTNPVVSDFLLSQPCAHILVGDPYQQIYAWRGAKDTMDKIPTAKVMYLTHSFRFGNNIATIANLVLRIFKNETKSLIGVKERDAVEEVTGHYTVICRTNAGVFKEAARRYKNRDIGFVGGIEGYRFNDIVDTYYLFSKKKSNIKNPYIKSFDSYKDMKDFAKAVEDMEILSRCSIVDIYMDKIPGLVRDITNKTVAPDEAEIILSTAHKSKGLEFDQVCLADDYQNLLENDGSLVNQTKINHEEINILYVAITRARQRLEITGDFKKFVHKETLT
ncbi:MAG: ATP-dependent helicase [Desulfobacterales bacterium]|nr:ATP-dependent helicase [Desulfobacterales bacterium]